VSAVSRGRGEASLSGSAPQPQAAENDDTQPHTGEPAATMRLRSELPRVTSPRCAGLAGRLSEQSVNASGAIQTRPALLQAPRRSLCPVEVRFRSAARIARPQNSQEAKKKKFHKNSRTAGENADAQCLWGNPPRGPVCETHLAAQNWGAAHSSLSHSLPWQPVPSSS